MTSMARRSEGFTLVELLIALLIMSVSLVSLMFVFNYATEHSKRPIESVRSEILAQMYSEELFAVPLVEPNSGLARPCSIAGSEHGEHRANLDDLDDYHAVQDSPPLSFGAALTRSQTAFESYQVGIKVSCLDARVRLVEILVTAPSGHQQRYELLRGAIEGAKL